MRSRVIRDGSASAGIELAPLAKTSSPLTRIVSEVPVCVRLVDHLHPAEPDLLAHGIARDRHRGVMERLLAIARRPPQRRTIELDRQRRLAARFLGDGDIGAHALAVEGEFERHDGVAAGGELDIGDCRDPAVIVMALTDDRVLDPGGVEEAELRLGIDAHHEEARPPVPAAMALGLAHHVEIGNAVVGDAPRDREG